MYYQGSSEIQADGLQTLYLMNPNYNGFSDTSQQSGNMLILNYAAGNAINLENLPNGQPPPPQPHLIGVPLQADTGSGLQDLKLNHLTLHSQHEVQPPRWWTAIDQTGGGNQENTHIPSGVVVSTGSGGGPAEVSVAQLGYHMPMVTPTRQAFSLSLSSQQSGYRSHPVDHNINQVALVSPRIGGGDGGSGGGYRASAGVSSSVSVITHGMPGGHGVVGTKYLKAAQELLDEVVNIEAKDKENEVMEKGKEKAKMEKESTASGVGQIGETFKAELTTAQKQEIQMRKAKLVSMLDEVEQRYRQYHHQMQNVVTSFEQATGAGSARSYTQLALQTISKKFRCLKDAILAQIKAASKSLGENDGIGGKFQGSSSRLKFVDQQIRQERDMQQLRMMQNNNVWRPQRGLPERAVSVLRSWLFEHFLHPYPKDPDKLMLAKQTGLTRSQVSNWFINARVRLWKPMVEEMYTEEMKNQECCFESNKNSGSKSSSPKDISTPRIDQDSTFKSKQANKRMSQEKTPEESSSASGFGLLSELNPERNSGKNPKKLRSDMQNFTNNNPQVDMDMDTQFGDTRRGVNAERQIKESFTTQMMANRQGAANGFVGFSLGELGQFNPEQLTTGFHGNGVSLTLGLPPSETLPLSGSQQNYLSDQNMELRSSLEMGSIQGHYDRVHKPQPPAHANMGYNDSIEFENRKRFAAQSLLDFVS